MEDAYKIKGGNVLGGEIELSGAKNVALKVIISALMLQGEVILHNIPRISDVIELMHLIKLLGGKAEFIQSGTVSVSGENLSTNKVDLLHGSKIRVSFLLFAPLLMKFGECFIPNPGGCRIGARPIDRIIDGMRKLGIPVTYDSATGYYHAKLHKPPSGSFKFCKPSHTGTELLLVIALLTNSSVLIENAALEPEIDDLISFLNQSGAKISRRGSVISVQQSAALKQQKQFHIISDRNEAITYATLALATKGNVYIRHICYGLIHTFVDKIKKAGAGFEKLEEDSYRFFYRKPLVHSSIETSPHPGFMTDWQPNWAVLMTQAKGESFILERVFENRFSYVEELRRLGARIEFVKMPVINPSEFFFFNFDPGKKYNQAVKVTGPQSLHGGVLTIADLRAGATLATAALIAEGESVVYGTSILERGYEGFVEKVTALGGDIRKI